MGWKTEVLSEGSWAGNSLVFATEQEAKDYGKELLSRWFVPEKSRAIQTSFPVSYTFDWTNGAQSLKK